LAMCPGNQFGRALYLEAKLRTTAAIVFKEKPF
jgi:hypothetical protein